MEDGCHYISGVKPVLELLSGMPENIECVFHKKNLDSAIAKRLSLLCSAGNIPARYAETSMLDRLCHRGKRGHVAHQGVVARLRMSNIRGMAEILESAGHAGLPLLLALDQIKDPGNLGTLCRTLYALGGAGMILPKHNAALIGPAAHKASAGSLALLPLAQVTNLGRALDLAEENDFHIYGASNSEPGALPAANAFECRLEFPAVIVLGSEEKGIRPGVAKRCGTLLKIPMANNFDSLNVAQAGAILIALAIKSHNYGA